MKKGCLIALCIIGGLIVLLFLSFVFFFSRSVSNNRPQIVLFDEPGERMEIQDYKVDRVLSDSTALARGKELSSYYGLTVLLYTPSGATYYDEQTIKAPAGKCFNQVGIYKYNGGADEKTIPVISLQDIK